MSYDRTDLLKALKKDASRIFFEKTYGDCTSKEFLSQYWEKLQNEFKEFVINFPDQDID